MRGGVQRLAPSLQHRASAQARAWFKASSCRRSSSSNSVAGQP
jgi:hypothetical protein